MLLDSPKSATLITPSASILRYNVIYVTDCFAIWIVLKRADGFKTGWPVLKQAGLFESYILAQPVLKLD